MAMSQWIEREGGSARGMRVIKALVDHDLKALTSNQDPRPMEPAKICSYLIDDGDRLVPGFDAKEDDRALSPIPNALVMFNPPLNFPGAKILDGEGNNIADKIAPTRFLNEKAPPSILFYGTKDGMKSQGSEYVAKCKELGVRAEMYLAEDEPHGFYNRSPWVERTVEKTDIFLQSLGYLKAPAKAMVLDDTKVLR